LTKPRSGLLKGGPRGAGFYPGTRSCRRVAGRDLRNEVTMTARRARTGLIRPESVQNRDDLARALSALRQSRDGLSLEKLERAAPKLSPSGRLAKSTVSDFLSLKKKTLPQTATLEAFLAVCGVQPGDRGPWHAALERARTADVRRPSDAMRVRDASPAGLGVHAAIRVDGQDEYLPRYVPRDLDAELHDLVDEAVKRGGFLLLIGGSSVGKTRSLLEALYARVPDWWLFHPEAGADLKAVAASHPVRTVIWLDELTRYLGGVSTLRAATVRKLIAAGVLVVGTMWPRDYDAISVSNDTSPAIVVDRADASDLLKMATVLSVPTDFTDGERARASALAGEDARLEVALDAGDPGVTQILAAAPDLVRRWEAPDDPYGAAVITTAIDACRLGMTAPVTVEHLRVAVPGYLASRDRAEAPADWLEQALVYATAKLRGAASALVPIGGDMGRVLGYMPAGYLLQRGFETRRAVVLPSEAWEALVAYASDPADLRRLAYSAGSRSRYAYVEGFLTKLIHLGSSSSARWLADLIAARNPRQAIEVLRPFSDQAHIAGVVTDLRVRSGDMDELRAVAETGDYVAACRLIGVEAEEDVQQIRDAAARGDRLAAAWLVDETADDQHVEQLRQRAGAGDRLAHGRLADIFASRGRLDEAAAMLTAAERAGDRLAGHQLIDLQLRHGTTEQQLRTRADAGDEYAEHAIVIQPLRGGHTAGRIASTLCDLGEHDLAIEILKAHDDAFVELTDDYLIDMLVTCNRIDLLREIAATGEPGSNVRLAELAAARGDVDELYRLEAEGNWFATQKLVELMLEADQTETAIEHLRGQAARDSLAGALLAGLLSQAGHEDELQRLAGNDPWHASGIWAEHLAKHGRIDEALTWLGAQRGPGADLAASQLAELLVGQNRLEEALDALRPNTVYGDGPSVSLLVDLLYENRRIDDLRIEVNAGAYGALDKLLDLLIEQGSLSSREAGEVRRIGVTATWPYDGSPPLGAAVPSRTDRKLSEASATLAPVRINGSA
jgi:hypothetical protein